MSDNVSKITLPSGDIYDIKDTSAIPSSEKGTANGVAQLDANGVVPSGQIPSSVYDHAVTNKGSAFSSGIYKITMNSEGMLQRVIL